MKKRWKPIVNSLIIKLFLSILIIIGPLIVIHIVNNYFSVKVITNQVTQSNENMLNIYMNLIDQELMGIENYLFQLSWNNRDLNYLQYNENMDQNDYELAKIRLYNSINQQSHFYSTFNSIFIYSKAYEDIIQTPMMNNNYQDQMNAVEEIIYFLENEQEGWSIYGRWNVINDSDGNHYLLHYRKFDDVFVGAWLNMERLIRPFEHIDLGQTGTALLVTPDLEPITSKDYIKERKIVLNKSEDNYVLSESGEQFVFMEEKSVKGEFKLVALIPEKEILNELPFLQRISNVVSIVAILFLFLFIFIMKKVFLQPIIEIVRAMKLLRNGNLDATIPVKRSSTEFEVMNDTFNHMLTEIKNLKINVYEEKINQQRAELKHLQLQINPHFFLNSLNIIYNLATVKNYELIQVLSKSLVNYFRFMFRSDSYFVRLDEELKHATNYLRIQELRYPDTFNYYVDTSQDLLKCKIPPLIIQTLMENSIKHAMDIDEPIDIYISVDRDVSDPEYFILKVKDTGEGFPDDVLRDLEYNESIDNKDGERIGLWNVRRRLELLYEKGTEIHFSNENGKGATVTIRIPIEPI